MQDIIHAGYHACMQESEVTLLLFGEAVTVCNLTCNYSRPCNEVVSTVSFVVVWCKNKLWTTRYS